MSTPKPSRAVDCHVHVFSASAPAVVGARYRPAYAAKLDALQALWTWYGTTHGVVVQPSFFGTDNHEMLSTVAGDPDRLRGIAVIDPSADDRTIARMHAAGIAGMRLNLAGRADFAALAGEEWQALYRRVHAHGWHVEVFVDAGRVPDIAPAFEGTAVDVVFDHFGNPGVDEAQVDATFDAVRRLARDRAVHVKLSAPYRLSGADRRLLARRWLEIVGVEGIVWGSDWPWTSFEDRNDYRRLREDLARWVGAEQVPTILWDNPARLYRF